MYFSDLESICKGKVLNLHKDDLVAKFRIDSRKISGLADECFLAIDGIKQ